jgi:hypothetical protein
MEPNREGLGIVIVWLVWELNVTPLVRGCGISSFELEVTLSVGLVLDSSSNEQAETLEVSGGTHKSFGGCIDPGLNW